MFVHRPDLNGGKNVRIILNLKDFGNLSINELYLLLNDLKLLPTIENFDLIYKLFKDYRNFIHPLAQKRKDWPINLGQAQMAIGLLNATIGYLD